MGVNRVPLLLSRVKYDNALCVCTWGYYSCPHPGSSAPSFAAAAAGAAAAAIPIAAYQGHPLSLAHSLTVLFALD